MNGSNLSRLQGILITLVATGAVFTSGCANMATTATGSNFTDSATAITGRVHGGNQPVAFATVNLWYAGQGGPAPAAIGATTSSANDGFGSFAFNKATSGTPSGNTYVCPSNNPLVYLVATGGNTLGTGDSSVNNTASVFLAPLGLCSSISSSTFIDMTEVSTVATMAALQQYFTPTAGSEAFSTDGTGLAKQAMTNAFTTIPNMVNLLNGTAFNSVLLVGSGGGATGTTVTAIPESAKINLMANILASCINNATATATNCTTLFNNATPPDPTTTSRPHGTTFATATDVLQATYYILTNPTNGSTTNLTNLYNLSSAVGAPFQPVLTSAPTDWTIGISYSSSSTCSTHSGHLVNSVQDLAIDTFGNVWLANNESGGNLTALQPNGAPITCIAIGTGKNTGITIDSLAGVLNISDIWLADNGASNVYSYNPHTGITTAFPTASSPSVNLPFGIAGDGTGNIYFTGPANDALYELPQAVGATGSVAPVAIATGIGSVPNRVVPDGTAVWTSSGTTSFTRTVSATPNSGTGFSSFPFTATGPTNGISVTALLPGGTPKNYVYVTTGGTNNGVDQYSGTGTSYAQDLNWPVTGLANPVAVAADGIQNVWVVDNTGNAIHELGANLQQLSPAGGFQKTATYLGASRSLIIDQAGNVWVGMDGTNTVTEIVGAAVPVYQPYATALRNDDYETIP